MPLPVPANSTVVADDVAATDGGKTDGSRRIALAGDALAGIDSAVLEVTAQRACDDLAHLERSAEGASIFVAVVGLG